MYKGINVKKNKEKQDNQVLMSNHSHDVLKLHTWKSNCLEFYVIVSCCWDCMKSRKSSHTEMFFIEDVYMFLELLKIIFKLG